MSFVKTLLGSLAARVSFNLFNINQTTTISSDSELLDKQQAQKDESLDAEWEEEDGSDEYITPSEATEGRKDLDWGIPSISMEEDGGASHIEAPMTVVQLDIWSPQEIPYHVLASATNNFSQEMMLGKGGFGSVYRGFLTDLAMDVAIKKLSEKSQQGLSEYMAEVKIITQVRHRNLVKLIGWCHEHGELVLVYELLPNGSLNDHLFRDSSNSLLDWSVRYKVAVGLANALTYLHDECEPCVLHRDVKSSNALLDSKFDTKLADFGLARHFSLDDSSVRVSCPAGTRGYWAPEYALWCRASRKSDVYSFGVVALEIACGKKAILVIEGENGESDARLLVEWVRELHGKGSILDAADKRLNGSFDQLQMERLLMVGLWCAQPDPHKRPSVRQAGNALLFPETIPLPDLPRTAVSWAHQNTSPKTKAHVNPMRRLFPQFNCWKKMIRTRRGLLGDDTMFECKMRAVRTRRELLGYDPVFNKQAVELFPLRAAELFPPRAPPRVAELFPARAPTDIFPYGNLLEQDGSAALYKGVLPDEKLVAVQRLSSRSDDGVLEWREQVVLLLRLQHRNLVNLLGFCIVGKERLLVYEYVSNRSMDKLLFGAAMSAQLDWENMYKIVKGIARGSQYLNKDSRLNIIHRDVNPRFIVLDAAMSNPEFYDVGIAKVSGKDGTLISSTRFAETCGYLPPEYLVTGRHSDKSDVFSFGALVLEIVTGQRNVTFSRYGCPIFQPNRVWQHWTNGSELETVDPSLGGQFQSSEVETRCIQLALLCVQDDPNDRPTMSDVLLLLSNPSTPPGVPSKPGIFAGPDDEAVTDVLGTPERFTSVLLDEVSCRELEAEFEEELEPR